MQTRVREFRRARGWSQLELAERAGVRQATISKIENAPAECEIETFAKIAKGLEVELSDLFGDPATPSLRGMMRNFLRLPREQREMLTRQIEALAERHRAGV